MILTRRTFLGVDRTPSNVQIEGCIPSSIYSKFRTSPVRRRQYRTGNNPSGSSEAKVPAEMWREVKARALAAYQAASPSLAELARKEFVKRFERELPSATQCFLDDFAACISHLRLPIAHRRAIRTTNLLERLFGEERRRTKVIPHAAGERAVLKLMYTSHIRASQSWRRVVINEFKRRQLEELRAQINEEFKQRTASAVSGVSRPRIYSKEKT